MSYKQQSKRRPFALQKGVFYTSKGHLLHCKRAPFTLQLIKENEVKSKLV